MIETVRRTWSTSLALTKSAVSAIQKQHLPKSTWILLALIGIAVAIMAAAYTKPEWLTFA